MTFPQKLAIAALAGITLGATTHWLVGALVFGATTTAFTLRQIRSEVLELRDTFPDLDSPPPSSLPSSVDTRESVPDAAHAADARPAHARS
jgi:hypothetical protein